MSERIRAMARAAAIPLLAVATGLVAGALIVVVTDVEVIRAWGRVVQDPGHALAATWRSIATAYGALFEGSLGSAYAISESLVTTTPYIFAGLAVALGFRAGLFNIGVEGQLFMGALASVWIGYSVKGLGAWLHLPLALLAGAAAGAAWAAIPGYLKARTGAHEVVNTIMMNYIAFRLSDWLLNGPMKRPGPGGMPGFVPISPEVLPSAYLPRLFEPPLRFHVGFFLALALAVGVWWLLWRTPLGFEMRSVGANPDAARTAGMAVGRTYVVAMALSGALAGLAGANQVLGVDRWLGQGFSPGYGFDSIALALLGGSHPGGVVLASLLFGTLRSGATRMQSVAGIPIDIITILQALILAFVAAPALVRALYRIRGETAAGPVLTRGWGRG
ncbi:ABC transporter permease [Geochorda subterranea]|uniref:ABC transporter permease n=1 Tax=Geochorda subterranea TaxID=3109564 RepID=A0ABZ1BRF2_9FIRM|nr:ABC transporter permease [Limnochorda sp. LNt]WRP14752.1 ABC transporter permease [Limnochorda sp. LNt]